MLACASLATDIISYYCGRTEVRPLSAGNFEENKLDVPIRGFTYTFETILTFKYFCKHKKITNPSNGAVFSPETASSIIWSYTAKVQLVKPEKASFTAACGFTQTTSLCNFPVYFSLCTSIRKMASAEFP